MFEELHLKILCLPIQLDVQGSSRSRLSRSASSTLVRASKVELVSPSTPASKLSASA